MGEPLIQQAYRFALDPSREQEEFLSACAGASRFWFNQGLALVKERLDKRAAGADVDVPWSYQALCVAFRGAAVKDELAPWRSEVVTGSYQAGLEALGRALQNYSAARRAGRRVGFPRFRVKGRSHEAVTFQRPRLPDSRHVMLDRRLGPLRSRESMRKLTRLLASDPNARVMRSTVQRVNGGWVISFTVQRSAKRRRARRPDAGGGCRRGPGPAGDALNWRVRRERATHSSTSTTTSSRSLPYMSPSRPINGVATDALSRYAVSTQLAELTDVCSECWMSGSAGATSDCSSA